MVNVRDVFDFHRSGKYLLFRETRFYRLSVFILLTLLHSVIDIVFQICDDHFPAVCKYDLYRQHLFRRRARPHFYCRVSVILRVFYRQLIGLGGRKLFHTVPVRDTVHEILSPVIQAAVIQRFEYNALVIVIRDSEKRIIRILYRDFAGMRFRIIRAVFLTYRRRNIILRSVQKLRIHRRSHRVPVIQHEIRIVARHDLTIHFHDRRRRFPRFRNLCSVQCQLRVVVCQRVFHVLDNLRHAD